MKSQKKTKKEEKKLEATQEVFEDYQVEIPDIKWHIKTFIITLLSVAIFYYFANIILNLYL
ncbi:MAG: hypothetical protein NZ870_04375, partial [bacterium]|nr:hypothetical protein [bacterium]